MLTQFGFVRMWESTIFVAFVPQILSTYEAARSCCENSTLITQFQVAKMSGPECCSNPPTLNPTSGEGHVEKLGGLNTYITGSSDSKHAILLVSDVYGTFRFLTFSGSCNIFPLLSNLCYFQWIVNFLGIYVWLVYILKGLKKGLSCLLYAIKFE